MSITSKLLERDCQKEATSKSAEPHAESPIAQVARELWNGVGSQITKATDKMLDIDLQVLKAFPQLDIIGLEHHMQKEASQAIRNQPQFLGEMDFARTDLQGEYDALPLGAGAQSQEVITGIAPMAGCEQQSNQQQQQQLLQDNSSFWHTLERTLVQTDVHQKSYATSATGGFHSYLGGGAGPD